MPSRALQLARISLTYALAVLAGCSEEPVEVAAPPPPLDLDALPGHFQGLFPCSDCPGVETTLWLRQDRVFFLRQHYLSEDDSHSPRTYYAFGTWSVDHVEQDLLLEGDGPTRRFRVHSPDQLEFRTTSRPAHLINRRTDITEFSDVITVEGRYTPGSPQYFQECKTGLRYEIAGTRTAARLRRQHRSMPRGQPVVAVLDARLNPIADGYVWAVDRIISLKPGENC